MMLTQYTIQFNMAIRQGTTALSGVYLGTTNVQHIYQGTGLVYTGTPTAAVSDFTSDLNGPISLGSSVQFTDNSTGIPTAWAWTFPGGTPATSTLQNPPTPTPTSKY